MPFDWRGHINNRIEQLLPQDTSRKTKDTRSRVQRYIDWVKETGRDWTKPDFKAYRKYLLKQSSLSPWSIKLHIATIQGVYRDLSSEERSTHPMLKSQYLPQGKSWHTEEFEQELDARSESQIEYLSDDQIVQLFTRIALTSNKGLRDRLIIGLLLFTGMSEQEICDLKVDDIDRSEDEIIITVPDTLEAPRQVQVYDIYFFQPRWFGAYLEAWLERSGITEGYLWRGMYKGGNSIRPTKLHHNAVQVTLRETEVTNGKGRLQAFTALDLRRTFARRLYTSGFRLEELQAILGHGSIQTTITYTGQPMKDWGGWKIVASKPYGQPLLDQLDQFMKNQK